MSGNVTSRCFPSKPPQPFFNKPHQLPRRNLQSFRKAEDRCKRRAFFRTLKSTDVTALRARKFGKLVLRERLLQAEFLQHLTKDLRR